LKAGYCVTLLSEATRKALGKQQTFRAVNKKYRENLFFLKKIVFIFLKTMFVYFKKMSFLFHFLVFF